MINNRKLIILILNLIFLGFTIIWYVKDKTFEPIVAIVGGLISMITYYITNDNSFSVKEVIITPESNSVTMNNSNVGNNTDIAGRDINKQKYHNEVGNIEKANTEIKDSVIHSNNYSSPILEKELAGQQKYLFVTINHRGRDWYTDQQGIENAIENALEAFESTGWHFHSMSAPLEVLEYENRRYGIISSQIIFTKTALNSNEKKITIIRNYSRKENSPPNKK